MRDELVILQWLIGSTEGAAAQLALAHDCAKHGKHAEGQVHVAITADAIAATHPDVITDPIRLSKALARYFLE